MSKFMVTVLTGVFVMGVSSVSFAGMFDKAIEATEEANTMAEKANTTAKDAKAKIDSEEQKAIEAQDASTQESGSMMDQAKETVKKTVNDTVNEKVDNFGK